MEAKHIVEGHLNLVHNKDQILKDLATKRMRHCKSCVLFDGQSCNKHRFAENINTGDQVSGCGCTMLAKTAVYAASCPLNKWEGLKKPLEALQDSEEWMKVTKHEFTNGDRVIFMKDGTWFFEDESGTESLIKSYDQFVSLVLNGDK